MISTLPRASIVFATSTESGPYAAVRIASAVSNSGSESAYLP
jgi:hypothetical protein